MALQVRNIKKSFGQRQVVQGVSFDVADGELVALLGPSGSGKSTILRIIAGLTECDSGTVEVDGVDVTGAAPQSRDLGFVFQNYALFEHMTVADNIEFALRVRGVPRAERAARRDELLEQVGLGGSARKYPAQLSGGQRQRTALARALAHRPRLLLLDEPFGALDAQIRQELRQGLRDLLKEIGTTAVFVTHDQEEAFAVADRIIVLHRGRLLEQGPPETLYQAPRTEFVARFVGRANVLPGEMTPTGVRVRLGRRPDGKALPKRVKVLFRPERLLLTAPDDIQAPRDAILLSRDAVVRHIEYLGASERIDLDLHAELDGAALPRLTLSVLRGVDQRHSPAVHVGKRVAVYGRKPHAITQPSLRLLVLADDSADGRRSLESMVAFAEREHCLLTVLGSAVRAGGLRQRLEQWRQSFAGDLKLLDPEEMGLSPLEAARTHLDLERYDLIVAPARTLQEPAWFELLGLSGVHHVLAAGEGDCPLAGARATSWSLLLNCFSAAQPDLGLFGELAQLAGAKVELHGQAEAGRSHEVVQPSLTALLLRSIKVSIASPAEAEPRAGDAAVPDSDLVAVDLGPRSRLGPAQRALLQQLRGRWSLLIVQPDEIDVELSTPAFVPAAEPARQPAASP